MAKAPVGSIGWHRPGAAWAKALPTAAGEAGSGPARMRIVRETSGEAGPPGRMSQATATQLAELLEDYEQNVRKLLANRGQMHLYGKLAEEVDEIRRGCAGVPELSVPWVMLLIAHAELIHSLWRGARAGSIVTWAERQQQLESVLVPARELKLCCLRSAGR